MVLKLWRADLEEMKAIQVECPDGRYPEKDADGESIYENSHYDKEEDAVECVRRNAEAYVKMAGDRIIEAERNLAEQKDNAANAAKEFVKYKENYPNKPPPFPGKPRNDRSGSLK